MSGHLFYAPDEADFPLRAPLYPVRRPYPVRRVGGLGEGVPGRGALPLRTSRAPRSALLAQDDRPGGNLLVAVDLPKGTNDWKKVEVSITQSDRAREPFVLASVEREGRVAVGSVRRPYPPWSRPPLDTVPEEAVRCRVEETGEGWRITFALSRPALRIPERFYFNVLRRGGDGGEVWAWSDLFGGPTGQVEVFAPAQVVEEVPARLPTLAMPAEVAVGLNRLRLEEPDPNLALRTGGKLIPFDHLGQANLPVRERGPVEVELVHTSGEGERVLAVYRADVPRPLLVSFHQPFLPAGAAEAEVEVCLSVVGVEEIPLVITCERTGCQPTTHRLRVQPGRSTFHLPLPSGKVGETGEVRLTAEADLTLGEETVNLSATHWCAVGLRREELDRWREGIAELPTERMLWAVLADAVAFWRYMQVGSGAFVPEQPPSPQALAWGQAFVFVPALLYKRAEPENPFTGDRRLLEPAVLGMEFALRPTVGMSEQVEPDNRSLQAYLLTYELLREEVPPAVRSHWAGELKRRVSGVVARWLRPLEGACGLTSADCGTGTNHIAYHIANVYLAGRLFNRTDWCELARRLMRRLARHGAEGHFEERRGIPVNHYTWLSANGCGEYFERSGDGEVEATLEAAARYQTAVTTAGGEVMALHDGRNARHTSAFAGAFVLSRTPEGRSVVRRLLLNLLRCRPSTAGLEALWRWAETALYFRPGEEADFTTDGELVFSRGVVVRRRGFHYALSTITLGPINRRYRLDGQNLVEVFHRERGSILHGGNSTLQPEAGTLFRKLDPAKTVRRISGPEIDGTRVPDALTGPTAPRVDFLPITASIHRLDDGHDLELTYWSFTARLAVHVLSERRVRLEMTTFLDSGGEPVIFNFFPGVAEGEPFRVNGLSLETGRFTIRANKPFNLQHPFRTINPYTLRFTHTPKPVRCWVELRDEERFVLEVEVK